MQHATQKSKPPSNILLIKAGPRPFIPARTEPLTKSFLEDNLPISIKQTNKQKTNDPLLVLLGIIQEINSHM